MINKRIEKYAVFSKSFRGMPNGWHNIEACNFLVGENSTGKSSFLQLIQLIDSREHMVLLDICGVVSGIDTPFDICSRSTDSKSVSIGFLIQEVENKKRKNYKGIFGRIASYRRVNDEMELERLSIISGNKILRLKKSRDRISYKIEDLEYDANSSHADNCKVFENIHFRKNERFRKHKEFNWQEVTNISAWLETMNAAVFDPENSVDKNFLSSYAPLRSLDYGPMRARTRRLYHGANAEFSSTGEHFPYLIRDMMKNDSELNDAVEKFGQASGLFDKISITSVRTEIKDKPFALQIEKSGSYFYVDELGFGVGQVLPIVTDIAFASGLYSFLIQQPELHLHPKAQAALGDVFRKSAETGSTLIIETHSDFIIDRFRLASKKSNNEVTSQIMYFEKDDEKGNVSHEIKILGDGSLDNVPDSYRSFFLNESVDKFENL